jgi:hypothetical protein
MPQLKKSLTRLVCPAGHGLTGPNRRPNGECVACLRKARKWKGNPVNRDKTHCPAGHPYEGYNLGKYKRGKNTIRYCRACRAKRAREYYWAVVKPLKHPGLPGRPRKYEGQQAGTGRLGAETVVA